MKRIIQYTALIMMTIFVFASCEEKVDYVDPTWARAIYPADGATVKIDFFKPDELQKFSWEVRPNSTYKIHIGTDMHFEKSYVFDMGTIDSLKISNEELLDVLREVWPDFASIKRFFWKVEQNTNGTIAETWRYFDAILAVESFEDPRDGQRYEARQFVMQDGTLMTIMAENLRAEVYSDGSEFPYPAKSANSGDPLYDDKVGKYYTWATAVNMSWEEAKTAYNNNQPVQGVCPDGWHVPSFSEYDQLRQYWGLWTGANEIKDPAYWKLTETLTNSTKMNIMASGYFWHEGVEFLSNGLDSDLPFAGFWTSTPYLKGMQLAWGEVALDDDQNKATLMSLYDDAEGVFLQGYGIVPGTENRCYPIRCVMDQVK